MKIRRKSYILYLLRISLCVAVFHRCCHLCCGSYPSFAKKIWEEYDLDPAFFEQDAEILKEGKVDLFTFSYYNTSCVTTHKDVALDGGGNLTLGVKNPYLTYSDWGWSIDLMAKVPGIGSGTRRVLADLWHIDAVISQYPDISLGIVSDIGLNRLCTVSAGY